MATSIDNERPIYNHESQLTFQTAVKLYESTIVNIIDGRLRLRDKLRTEIEYLVKEKVCKLLDIIKLSFFVLEKPNKIQTPGTALIKYL